MLALMMAALILAGRACMKMVHADEYYNRTYAQTPYGSLLIFLPSQIPSNAFTESEKVWENESFLALKDKDNNAAYYLILGKPVPYVQAVLRVAQDERLFWLYVLGKPNPVSQEIFEDVIGLPVPCWRAKLDPVSWVSPGVPEPLPWPVNTSTEHFRNILLFGRIPIAIPSEIEDFSSFDSALYMSAEIDDLCAFTFWDPDRVEGDIAIENYAVWIQCSNPVTVFGLVFFVRLEPKNVWIYRTGEPVPTTLEELKDFVKTQLNWQSKPARLDCATRQQPVEYGFADGFIK
jgi:hypothetical protein